jgi:phosphopentomutase
VPILAWSAWQPQGSIGSRSTFADVGASIASYLNLPPSAAGSSFLR